MFLSQTVSTFLDRHDVDYETLGHAHTATTAATAREAHVPSEQLAKAVLFCDDEDYVLAIVPATSRVDRIALSQILGERDLMLAPEEEIQAVFPDCAQGAVPAVGLAYGIDTVVDDALLEQSELYFEAGDHEHIVHVDNDSFRRLMAGAPRGHISEDN